MANKKDKKEKQDKSLFIDRDSYRAFAEKNSKKITELAAKYMDFLANGYTERMCVATSQKLLTKNGFSEYSPGEKLTAGDRRYFKSGESGIIAFIVGNKKPKEGVHIIASHIDSPRLDLKPIPLIEQDGTAFLKTHYYGGVRKYQWGAIPLALCGIVYRKDGSALELNIGTKDTDPVFTIMDLLPHLAAEQSKRTLSDGLKGEELNVVVGGLPDFETDENEAVKLAVLKILNNEYQITENDFIRAELEIVPAFRPSDVGLDRSMVGAYGQDDRSCSYAGLRALLEQKTPDKTAMLVLADKEEIGSVGPAGLGGDFLKNLLTVLAGNPADYMMLIKNSFVFSGDVAAAYDGRFSAAFDKNNSAFLGHGLVLTKYTGSRGKGGCNDASAETMSFAMRVIEESGASYQVSELGAVDAGGGGTVAAFLGDMGLATVDIGVAVASMHSPFEVISKADLYALFLAYSGFFAVK